MEKIKQRLNTTRDDNGKVSELEVQLTDATQTYDTKSKLLANIEKRIQKISIDSKLLHKLAKDEQGDDDLVSPDRSKPYATKRRSWPNNSSKANSVRKRPMVTQKNTGRD